MPIGPARLVEPSARFPLRSLRDLWSRLTVESVRSDLTNEVQSISPPRAGDQAQDGQLSPSVTAARVPTRSENNRELCCDCSQPVLALSGRAAARSRMSALRGRADLGGAT